MQYNFAIDELVTDSSPYYINLIPTLSFAVAKISWNLGDSVSDFKDIIGYHLSVEFHLRLDIHREAV